MDTAEHTCKLIDVDIHDIQVVELPRKPYVTHSSARADLLTPVLNQTPLYGQNPLSMVGLTMAYRGKTFSSQPQMLLFWKQRYRASIPSIWTTR